MDDRKSQDSRAALLPLCAEALVPAGPAVDTVAPGLAVEAVRSGPAGDAVVALAAVDRILAGVAGDRVGVIRAVDVLDPCQAVFAVAARAAGDEIDADAGRRLVERDPVDSGPAVERVVSGRAVQAVGSRERLDRVVPMPPRQLGFALPSSVSSNSEPMAPLTPTRVSVPCPLATPLPRSTETGPGELSYAANTNLAPATIVSSPSSPDAISRLNPTITSASLVPVITSSPEVPKMVGASSRHRTSSELCAACGNVTSATSAIESVKSVFMRPNLGPKDPSFIGAGQGSGSGSTPKRDRAAASSSAWRRPSLPSRHSRRGR
jgi:hypothetical protein